MTTGHPSPEPTKFISILFQFFSLPAVFHQVFSVEQHTVLSHVKVYWVIVMAEALAIVKRRWSESATGIK